MVAKTLIYSYIFIVLGFQTNLVFAQKKVEFGIGTTFSIKSNYFSSKPQTSLLYNGSLMGSFVINNQEYNNLGMMLDFGVDLDYVKFNIFKYDNNKGFINFNKSSIFLNPKIIFSTNFSELKILTGFSLNYYFATNVGFGQSGNNNSNNYAFSVNANHLEQIINANSNKIIPSLNIGAIFKITNHYTAKILLQQHLLNHFKNNTYLSYKLGLDEMDLEISYIPLFLTVGLYYYL